MADSKSAYHHGDLSAALVDAGLALTRTGGPDALTIRAATRRAGVSPNAAYRHFAHRDELLAAVATAILEQVAARMQHPPPGRGPAAAKARGRLRAVGLGYIKFALDEPGWFSVAFFGSGFAAITRGAGAAGMAAPYRALVEALDEMADAKVLSRKQRDGAEWACWSAVHGFAELALHGPLRAASRGDLESLACRTVDDIVAGLSRRR